jgi:FAD:protein FMN transferase
VIAELQRLNFTAMGTLCTVAVTAERRDGAAASLALSAAWNEVITCERILSRFDSHSELSALNRNAGTWLQVDERLFDALTAAVQLRSDSDGRFDPTVLPALVALGYDRTFQSLEPRPRRPNASPAGASIELDPLARRARIECNAAVDLGGIGKGFAAARAVDAMWASWPHLPGALVDLGGDIAAVGTPPEGGPWLVSVESPWRPGKSLGTIRVDGGGVATSGPTRRRFGPDRSFHHLLDPENGEPADRGPLVVTVVARDPAAADAHATALAVSEDAREYMHGRPGLGALVVRGPEPPQTIGAIDFVPRPVSFEVTL